MGGAAGTCRRTSARLDTHFEAFGFELKRVSGSHHIFAHPHIPEVANIQEIGGEAKPYQIRQFLRLVGRYNLELEDEP